MYKRQNQLVLDWLLDKVQVDLAEEVKFKLYSLPVLLYELAREENRSMDTSLSMSSLSGCDTTVPTISIAEAQLDRDMFIFIPGLSCSWHEDVETSHCTSATLSRWSFIVFSLCCPLYGLELLPGKHLPAVEEMSRSGVGRSPPPCQSQYAWGRRGCPRRWGVTSPRGRRGIPH